MTWNSLCFKVNHYIAALSVFHYMYLVGLHAVCAFLSYVAQHQQLCPLFLCIGALILWCSCNSLMLECPNVSVSSAAAISWLRSASVWTRRYPTSRGTSYVFFSLTVTTNCLWIRKSWCNVFGNGESFPGCHKKKMIFLVHSNVSFL